MNGWVKLSDEALNRCPWCLHDKRNGTHGEIGEERDGVIPVRCLFETMMRYHCVFNPDCQYREDRWRESRRMN